MGIASALIFSIWAALLDATIGQATTVLEVNVGNTAILTCGSNDNDHIFQFWQILGDNVIGPANKINTSKYKYEVLSGTLFIKSVSTAEEGFYKCISKGISGPDINIHTVELVVKRDWEEVYESDLQTNVYRGMSVVAVILACIIVAFLIYRLVKRRRLARFRDMSDEESPDEAPARGTYNVSNLPPMAPTSSPSQGVDNPALETDFPKVFKTLQTSSDAHM